MDDFMKIIQFIEEYNNYIADFMNLTSCRNSIISLDFIKQGVIFAKI